MHYFSFEKSRRRKTRNGIFKRLSLALSNPDQRDTFLKIHVRIKHSCLATK